MSHSRKSRQVISSVVGPTNQQSNHMEVDDGSDDDDAFNYYGLLSPDELADLVENQQNSDSESRINVLMTFHLLLIWLSQGLLDFRESVEHNSLSWEQLCMLLKV